MASFMNNFFNGQGGMKASDYYYKYNTKGAKYYYSKLDDSRVSKDRLNPSFISKIEQRTDIKSNKNKDEMLNLLAVKQDCEKTIESLKLKLIYVNQQIDALNNKTMTPDEIKNLKTKLEQDNRDNEEFVKRRKAEIKQEQDAEFYEFMKQFEKDFKAEIPPKTENPPKTSEVDLLKKYDIKSKTEWKQWLLKNHPDKGGDSELCSQIISAGRKIGY